ncbi:MAG: hypothetical protein KKA84_10500 [Bacteroidetes bacterium]|nr:hypothetical protein [Bacteroidota bacterium]
MGFVLPKFEEIDLFEKIKPLQNCARVVTAFSSQFIHYNEIRKENTLKVSHRGLTTQSIPYFHNDELIYFEMELDFILQSLWIRIGEEERQIPFNLKSEEEFYSKTRNLLNDLGFSVQVKMNTFNDETEYFFEQDIMEDVLKVLHFSVYSLKKFRSELSEITSSVQFRPHYFDQIISIITDRVLIHQGEDNNERRETVDFGFSLGDDNLHEPYFFVTANPFPENLISRKSFRNAYWRKTGNRRAVLTYKNIADSHDPFHELNEFYRFMYAKILSGLSK